MKPLWERWKMTLFLCSSYFDKMRITKSDLQSPEVFPDFPAAVRVRESCEHRPQRVAQLGVCDWRGSCGAAFRSVPPPPLPA